MSKDDDSLAADLTAEAAAQMMPIIGGPLASRAWLAVRREWGRNSSKALAAAEKASKMTREDLEEFIENDPRAVPLYLHVLWAAGMNGHDTTLHAMGAVFGDAARASRDHDDERLEDLETSLRAMSGLGPRHFRALKHLILNPPRPPASPGGGKHYLNCTPEDVAAAVGLSEGAAHQCLFNMAGAGLVTQATGLFGGATGYEATELGKAVAQAVEHVSSSAG